MFRFIPIALLSAIASAQLSPAPSPPSIAKPATKAEGGTVELEDFPLAPQGKSTVIGGSIRQVDGVRDQITLNIYGGRTIKVLFDERTQAYRDGQKSPLHDLRAGDNVSVETVLDGTAVFARSIHMLSQLPEGAAQGQIMKYDRGAGELMLHDSLFPDPIKLRVPATAAIVHEGQEVSSGDLKEGALVSVLFQANGNGQNVARKITLLANPGSLFVFVGKVVFLDLRAGLLALVDPRDNKKYDISFDPGLAVSRELHEGTEITVTADFDGTRYSARSIALNSVPQSSSSTQLQH